MNPVPIIAFSLLTLLGLVVGLVTSRRLWAVVDTPTIAAGHAFPGRIEVFGVAELPHGVNLTSPFTGATCAWWQAEVQKEVQTGKTKSWRTQATITSEFQVLVRDDSGYVRVDLGSNVPRRCRSEILGQSSLPNINGDMMKRVAAGALLHTLSLPDVPHRSLIASVIDVLGSDAYSPYLNLATASGDWQVSEKRLDVGDHLYVLGNARSIDSGPLLISGKHGSLYSYRGDEGALITRLRRTSIAALVVFGLGAAALWGYVQGNHNTAFTTSDHFSIPHALFAGWLALLCIAIVQAVRIRNRIVAAKEQVQSSWALIDVASAKRASLVPLLVDIVKGVTSYEASTLEHLTQARSQSIAANGPIPDAPRLAAATNAHDEGLAALADLHVLQERYPSMNTSANYMQLFRELTELEDGVAAARGYYVDAQTVLKDRLQTFPDSWLAGFAGPLPADLIERPAVTN